MYQSSLAALSLVALAAAQNLGSCRNEYNGYCCQGSIISSGGSDAIDLICCQGDPNDNTINLGSGDTCTAGTAIPLTQASSVSGGGQTISDITASGSGGATFIGTITGDGSNGMTTSMSTSATETSSGSAQASSTSSGSSESQTASSSSSSSSSGSAGASAESGTPTSDSGAAMMTSGPLAGSLMLAGGYLLAAL